MAMLVALTVSAQRLHVTEARQTIEPMTVAMQRTDFNNEICALVKVQLPIAGTGFEGNLIGDTPFKINEYWVYLTPGTKMLHIKAPGYYPLMADFRELGLGHWPERQSIIWLLSRRHRREGLRRKWKRTMWL